MSAVDLQAGEKKKAGVRRMVKHHLRIDMTPMVDLGFLLIAFFVVTTELAKPTAMDLIMPKDSVIETKVKASNALTVLLDGDKIYYYHGEWEIAEKNNTIFQTTLSGNEGLRKIIGDKQHLLDISAKNTEGRDGLMILIKPLNNSSYKTVVDVLDEMTIDRVKKYALLKLSAAEKVWLKLNADFQEN